MTAALLEGRRVMYPTLVDNRDACYWHRTNPSYYYDYDLINGGVCCGAYCGAIILHYDAATLMHAVGLLGLPATSCDAHPTKSWDTGWR